MFQIATTIGYSIKHGISYCIPENTMNNVVWPPHQFPFVSYCGKKTANNTFLYKEPEHSYRDIPKFDEDVILEGYWQSEKYFSHCREEIVKAFGFYLIPSGHNSGIVALHKRLGDYKLYPTKHPIITEEYIRTSISYFYDKGYRKFMIFSDEIEECKQTINADIYKGVTFHYSEGRNEIEDMQLMSACEHFIISASTFSWWAAWLSNNLQKIVITPREWFGIDNSHLSTKDLVPKGWLKM